MNEKLNNLQGIPEGQESCAEKTLTACKSQTTFRLGLDKITSTQLGAIERLEALQPNGKKPSRSLIVRRSLRLYYKHLQSLLADDSKDSLEAEREALKQLTYTQSESR